MMTVREVFNTVKAHLLKQGAKALRSESCVYRSPEGLKCAAGALIKDEHYTESLEGGIVCSGGRVEAALLKSGVPQDAMRLVNRLQVLHDCSNPDRWAGELDEVEIEFGLAEVSP